MDYNTYPENAITDVAMKILKESVLGYRFDIWNVISQEVISDVFKNSGICYGYGFSSSNVKKAIGRALCKHIGIEE